MGGIRGKVRNIALKNAGVDILYVLEVFFAVVS